MKDKVVYQLKDKAIWVVLAVRECETFSVNSVLKGLL